MAETTLTIVVSEGDIDATIDAIEVALPEGTAIVPAAEASQSLEAAFQIAVGAAGNVPSLVGAWWRAARDAGGIDPALSFLLFALVLAVAYAIEWGALAALRKRGAAAAPTEAKFSNKLRITARWCGGRILGLLLFCGLAYVGIGLVTGPDSHAALLATALFQVILRFRVVLLILETLAASTDPARRLTGLTDAEAKYVIRVAVLLLSAVAVINFTREFVVAVTDYGESGALFAVATVGLATALTIGFMFSIRHPIARIIKDNEGPSEFSRGMTSFFANYWHFLFAFLLVISGSFQAIDYLTLEAGGASEASKYSFMIFFLAPFLTAGLRNWREEVLAEADAKRQSIIVGVFALSEGMVIILAAILLLLAWKIDPFAPGGAGIQRFLPGVVSAALSIVVGLSVWRTIKGFLDIYAPRDDGTGVLPDDEGGGPGGSRLETVYPMMRGVTLVVITTITLLVTLSALGFEIGPLIASAGVIGLAVGFGAQTLVKDIISGVFYLYEDAFRVGEYIKTSEGKGVVERILLRSVRLRHSRGAVYTIPFGDMGTIQNHSRDWVKVKFTFEVAASEDLERVRKLVKNVGKKLSEDPEIKDNFIEPLKSQGAVAMVGPNYQIGVKFICPPGEQFLIRRKAFVAIQDAIEENGITIGKPQVVVNMPADVDREAAAAAAAALPQPETTA